MKLQNFKKAKRIHETLENLRVADTYLSKELMDQSNWWVSITNGSKLKIIQDEGLKLKIRGYLQERIKELEEEFANL